MIVRRVVAGVLVAGLSLGPLEVVRAEPQAAQAAPRDPDRPSARPASPSPVDVDELPISVDRIGRRLARPATLSLELSKPMFRTEVVETRPKWWGEIEWLSEQDARLPVPNGPAWHREFLSMVTPPQARPFGQVTGFDLLQLVASSFAQGVATNMVAGKIKKAVERRRAADASAEVDAAIEAWKADREKAAGTPAQAPHAPASAPSPPR